LGVELISVLTPSPESLLVSTTAAVVAVASPATAAEVNALASRSTSSISFTFIA